jgi:hypothetical protein
MDHAGGLGKERRDEMNPSQSKKTEPMKRFLAVYLGSAEAPGWKQWQAMDDTARKARERSGIDAWMRWGEEHRASIVDEGGPLGKTKRADPKGVSDARNAICGYVVVEAESHEAAARLFLDHPHFSIFPGESVEIIECLPLPQEVSARKRQPQAQPRSGAKRSGTR